MNKETAATNSNNTNTGTTSPLGNATTTSSGVTVFNSHAPLPPTYDQAMGNATPFVATGRTYTTANAWNAPGMGAPNTGYTLPASHTTTTYTTYGSTVPPPQPHPPPPSRQTAFVQPPVVIIQQQPMLALGPEPVYLTCPACHVQKLTRIEYEPSSRTHLMAALLCLVGLWCCVCLPYCAGSCMNTHHYCGNCDKFLGTYGNAL